MEPNSEKPVRGVYDYRSVSNTFTYAVLYAAAPLLFIYELGLLSVNEGLVAWARSDIESLFLDLVTLFGRLPNDVGMIIFLAIFTACSAYAIRREKRIIGEIAISHEYLFWTLLQAVAFGGLINPILSVVCFGQFPQNLSLLELGPGQLTSIVTFAAGAGFFEELLYRVIGLGLAVKIASHYIGMNGKNIFFVVAAVAFLFSLHHFLIGMYQFTVSNFAYLFFLGIFYGYLYLKRGFAVTAWTHAFTNVMAAFYTVAADIAQQMSAGYPS